MKKYINSLKRVIKQLYFILNKQQKIRALVVFASMIFTSVLELLGVSVISPFLQALITPNTFREKKYVKLICTIFPDLQDRGLFVFIGVVVVAVFAFKNVVALRLTYIQHKFAVEFQRDESTEMLSSYMKRHYQFFINTNSSILLRGINTDTGSAYCVLLYMFQLMGDILTIMMLSIFLITTDWLVALGSLAIVSLCSIIMVLAFKNRIKVAGQLFRQASAERNQYSYQAINGIKEIIVLDRRDLFVQQYKRAAQKMAEASLVNSFYASAPDRILEGICVAGIMGIICLRIILGVNVGDFIPAMGAFAMGAFKILPSFSKISARINGIIFNMPGLQNCYDNIAEARKTDKTDDSMINGLSALNDTIKESIEFSNSISICNLSWKYQNSKSYVLKDLSLTIGKGESVAIIGASGSGKTTLADIIMALLRPEEGYVYMDGVDIFEIHHKWSRIIGYVPQSVYLVDDSIRANVAFGLPNEIVSDEKVWLALEQAHLSEYIQSLPDKLNTIVGEQGVKISGGQKQRIAIARALYENPDILVMDEATSALDTETENLVMESIDALHGTKTLIIVAHRLTTIKNCDRIYEIVDGKAVERSYEELNL